MYSTPSAVLARAALQDLISALVREGYQVIGPRLSMGAIVYAPLASADELPLAWRDVQEAGSYRLEKNDRAALFDYVVGPHSWKRYLFPPRQRLWQARRKDDGFQIDADTGETPRYAFIGVRSCEIHAMQIQDRVFDNADFADPGYVARRQAAFIVAVNCARPGSTCFCTSQRTGPKVKQGFDLALTEILEGDRHEFVTEAGSARGSAILTALPQRPAEPEDIAAAQAVSVQAAEAMGREMSGNAAEILRENPEHPRWDKVAQRCLSCGNCTMVCPTCFCTSVEDSTDLSGEIAERWRQWDSCFSIDFSYLHGGSIRNTASSRYRQWLTHKLAYWHEQFDSSGCVGCGRCITWCPVGIDIREEVQAMCDGEVESG